jgi:hypothetical protein
MSYSAQCRLFSSYFRQSWYAALAGLGISSFGLKRLKNKLTLFLRSVSKQNAWNHTYVLSTRLSGTVLGHRNNFVHSQRNPPVFHLMCTHLNSGSTETVRCTCNQAVLNHTQFCKTSFLVSQRAVESPHSALITNQCSWHVVIKCSSQAINNICHITLFYCAVCSFEWHGTLCL